MKGMTLKAVAAGSYHCLAVSKEHGQVISWGAGEYGQLGHGWLWDEPKPTLINEVMGVVQISAGTRHSMAIVCKRGAYTLLGWGYNGYGELGTEDVEIRTQPVIISSFNGSKIKGLSCGDRHTVVVTSHKPAINREDPLLAPYYAVMEDAQGNKAIEKKLKKQMERQGIDSKLLDIPNASMLKQIGATNAPLRKERFEKGLQYCLDTKCDPEDWRHKAYEICFECVMPGHVYKGVCLSCARQCLSHYGLRPYIRKREVSSSSSSSLSLLLFLSSPTSSSLSSFLSSSLLSLSLSSSSLLLLLSLSLLLLTRLV